MANPRLLQPDSTGACCCRDDCGPCVTGPTVTAGACVSRTGSGYLRGWSKFQNYNSGDWNVRKALIRTINFSAGIEVFGDLYYNGTGCTYLPTLCDPALSVECTRPEVIWDPSSNAISQTGLVKYTRPCYAPYEWTRSKTSELGFDEFSTLAYGFDSVFINDHVRRSTPDGPGVCGFHGYYWDCKFRDIRPSYRELRQHTFDTVSAAIDRHSGPEPGGLCKATAGTIGSTTGESTTQITISSTTSVTVPLTCSGLTASSDYTITVSIKRYTAGGGAYVDTIQDTITFTAGGTTEEMDYHVPVNTDYDYEYSAVSIAAA